MPPTSPFAVRPGEVERTIRILLHPRPRTHATTIWGHQVSWVDVLLKRVGLCTKLTPEFSSLFSKLSLLNCEFSGLNAKLTAVSHPSASFVDGVRFEKVEEERGWGVLLSI